MKKEKSIHIEKYNQEIEDSGKQIMEEKTVSHIEISKKSRKWFKRRLVDK